MLRRRVLSLLAVVFALTLLPATAFAHDHGRRDGDHHGRYWGHADHDRDDEYREYRRYHPYYDYRHSNWRDRCVDPDHDGDCDFIRPRHHHHHHHWMRYRCVDPDHDGDCDFIRPRYPRYYQNGWYGDGYYSNPYLWGSYPYAGNRNGAWQNGRWGNRSVPPGWHHGRKRGWGESNLPPGLAKKPERW